MSPFYGDTVHVHFCATVDGVVIDSTVDSDPLLVTIGTGQVVPGFDRALTEMMPGQSMAVTVPAADAYGEHDPHKVHDFPLHRFKYEPQTGETIEFQGPSEKQRVTGVVLDVTGDTVRIDFNHRFAGKEITFDIELMDVAAESSTYA